MTPPKKPYIYTMPESFMKDDMVPARWRILGILNGFHANNLTFYGSNRWLKEQLGCSQQAITQAIKDLEDMGLVVCERTFNTRIIHKKLSQEGDTSQLVGGYKLVTSPPTSQHVSNSDNSNSDNNNSLNIIAPKGAGTKKAVNPIEDQNIKDFIGLFKPLNAGYARLYGNKTQREAALRLYKLKPWSEWLGFFAAYRLKFRSDSFCPKAITPWELEQKLQLILAYGTGLQVREKREQKKAESNIVD